MKCLTACRSDACPKKIIRLRHSSFIERTKRSAKAFRSGNRGGQADDPCRYYSTRWIDIPYSLIIFDTGINRGIER